jgi:carbamoyl-phosphate synthase small subunit
MKKAILVLEDGSVYEGYSFGAETTAWGEVVFNTSMTGYQEMLTDPSYAGQIVVPTYPLIGNYGISEQDIESRRIQVRGFVLREECPRPSHWLSHMTLHQYLVESNIPGLAGIDTRALTRRLRSAGVMMGLITTEMTAEEAQRQLRSLPRYDAIDFVKEVSAEGLYTWRGEPPLNGASKRGETPLPNSVPLSLKEEGDKGGEVVEQPHIVVVDGGVKYNILRILQRLGTSVTVAPCTASAEEILKLNPDGVVFSPGPGDPALLGYMEETLKGLVGRKPVMGICLGHQVLGRAFGGKTFKLKFGHRGGNHPVKDLTTGRVHITAQNHGYAVDGDSLKGGLEVSQVNLNDGTVEGLRHKELPIFSIQYHSEASPGPRDNVYMFERFVEMVRGARE